MNRAKRDKKYAKIERERIAEIIAKIESPWILGHIYKFALNMSKGEKGGMA